MFLNLICYRLQRFRDVFYKFGIRDSCITKVRIRDGGIPKRLDADHFSRIFPDQNPDVCSKVRTIFVGKYPGSQIRDSQVR